MLCPRCQARGKTWNGADPKCAFPDQGQFNSSNWNCATANALRDLCGDEGCPWRDKVVETHGVRQAYGIRWDDKSWGAINIIEIDLERDNYKTLWLSWYKLRGRTDAMLLLNDVGSELPTYADCDAILNHFGRTETAAEGAIGRA